MLGTIGAIVGVAGTAASGIMSAINNKKRERQAQAETARQAAYAEAMANEDPLVRAGNQRLLAQYDREGKRQIENARNVSTITGATPEYAVAVQEGVAQGRADMMSNIAAEADARRDKYMDKAEEARRDAANAAEERALERNQTYANIAANAAQAAGSLMSGIGGSKKAPKAAGGGGTPTDSGGDTAFNDWLNVATDYTGKLKLGTGLAV